MQTIKKCGYKYLEYDGNNTEILEAYCEIEPVLGRQIIQNGKYSDQLNGVLSEEPNNIIFIIIKGMLKGYYSLLLYSIVF